MTKVLFLLSTLLTFYLYQEVHQLSTQQSQSEILQVPTTHSSVRLKTTKGTLGTIQLVIEQNSYYAEGYIEVLENDTPVKALLTSNVTFNEQDELSSGFFQLDTGTSKVSIDLRLERTPNTQFKLQRKTEHFNRVLQLPLDIIREKTEFDKHIIFYRQNSPLVKEIFASLMQYVFDTEGVCISKESDGAEIKDHLRFDRLCSFVQGELLSIMNQKGFEPHDQ